MRTVEGSPLASRELDAIDAWWRAANYLSVGQIYLLANPLLREPLEPAHIKPRLLGHWGTTPGLNFVYAHFNRVIRAGDLDVINVTGPGHGGPGIVANAWLEGTYSEIYPLVPLDAHGMGRLFKQFSFPGGIPSHAAPDTPGSINEGGELGYSLMHAYGAAFDNPDLVVACVIGDGEAETGPLATSWHSNKFLDPVRDGAVLPILHLNGYKIANPTVLDRITQEELGKLLEGYGYAPYLVEGDDPAVMHQLMAATLDEVIGEIGRIQSHARGSNDPSRPRWPVIVLRSPKGWTGPKEVDGLPVEGTWRAHQVPVAEVRTNPEHLRLLEEWMRSYRPQELFDVDGRPVGDLVAQAPVGNRRMSANPHANGGLLTRDLFMPDFREYAVEVKAPGSGRSEATRVLGTMLRDIFEMNAPNSNFRLFGPDETASNRLDAVYQATPKAWNAAAHSVDVNLAPDGRVMEVLSEHLCQGWLEGYLLTGRHGFFSCYEAFIHIVDSMFNQHAKWLKTIRRLDWRRPIPSLNYLLTSHVWRQDHNGFSHQDPGFIDYVVTKKAEVIRVYLAPDTNTLLSVADHCLRSRNYVNVIVAGKQPNPNWLNIDDAVLHATRGVGIWEWASSDDDGDPDVVMACAGDVPTLETLAAVDLLRQHLPQVKVRVINVVDLMRLQPDTDHPHGLNDRDFDALFTVDKPVIFAYHGYPMLIHRLTYGRANHDNFHVKGYMDEGTTTTPFEMVAMNNLDRYHLVMDVIKWVPSLGSRAARANQEMADRRILNRQHAYEHGDDLPEVRDWDLAVLRSSSGMEVLVVNAGSSSLKLSVVTASGDAGASTELDGWEGDVDVTRLTSFLEGAGRVDAVGHRVVHGGTAFVGPVMIDDGVEAGVEALTSLAPVHQPRALAGIRAVRRALPGVPAVACFDTAFHATLPPEAYTYALPAAWSHRWSLRRYGFHGLSHSYAARRTAELTGRGPEGLRVVTAHLGAGASLCAVVDGRSVDTTMGFTPVEGVVMATRSGSVDPGMIAWLIDTGGLGAGEVADALERSSGLAGMTGGSGDMREVLAGAEAGRPEETVALDVYLHRLTAEVAAMAAACRGLDVLVFTGGVGEHAPAIRSATAARLEFLGVAIDEARNDAVSGDADITAGAAAVTTLVVTAREDLEIARQVRSLLAGTP